MAVHVVGMHIGSVCLDIALGAGDLVLDVAEASLILGIVIGVFAVWIEYELSHTLTARFRAQLEYRSGYHLGRV